MGYLDPHSVTSDSQPLTKHVDLHLSLDFDSRTIAGVATLTLARAADGVLDLDQRGLVIKKVVDGTGQAVQYSVEEETGRQGGLLRLHLKGDKATIEYQVSPSASALQWLEPQQTAGGRLPYVFTQCQAIHARSVLPCQDTPAARITYSAKIQVPRSMRAVMAAVHSGREEAGDIATESFHTGQPIPPYLFAFAAGDIACQDLGPRSRIYAEPANLAAAAWEFEGVEQMISHAEALFGPYLWGRFDLLLMPPSFPYGGMENPRLTFLTPTIVAGDRSLVNVVAHELAHSWTGNLVTNATANDFWLNEGWTVYAERRILEVVEGPEKLGLHSAIGYKTLMKELERFKDKPLFTRLRTNLEGIDPDDVYSSVPYEKGCLFLNQLEAAVGRSAFDEFIKCYIDRFQFQSISTQTFLDFLQAQLPGIGNKVDLPTWVDGEGLPSDVAVPTSETLRDIEAAAQGLVAENAPTEAASANWKALEWDLYLQILPKRLPLDVCRRLDDRFRFSSAPNAEVRMRFLAIAATSGYSPCFPAIKEALLTIGRMKYLRPLYGGLLASSEEAQQLARDIFQEAGPKYHPVARAVIDGLFSKKQ